MRLSEEQVKTGAVVSQGEPWVPGVEGIVSRTRRRERRMGDELTTDKLTGLQNQRAWLEARYRVESDPGLMIGRLDVDGFKSINDSHGHSAGDSHLQAVAKVIQDACAGVGISPRMRFRTGGDEFTIVGSKEQVAVALMDINKAINFGSGTNDPGTVSFGAGPTEEEADRAMYNVKRVMRPRHWLVINRPKSIDDHRRYRS